jgi:AcrR family transcriptional regulator
MGSKQAPSTARKKPVQRRAAGTLAAFFEAVAQILERGGRDKLTTNHVAERAGFSIGTLYSYFSDKQSLIRAMALCELEKQDALVSRALAEAEATRVRDFAQIVVRTVLGMYDGRHRVRREVMMIVGVDAEVIAAMNAALERVAEAFVDAITAKAVDVAPTISREARFIMLHAVLGAVRAATLTDEAMLESAEFEEQLVGMLCRFCVAPPALVG